MRKIIRVLIIAILLILNLLNGITTAIAQEEVIISLGIPPKVLVSNDFTVMLNTTSLIDFDAGQFDISFDNSVLRLDNVTAGLIGTTDIPVSLWNEINPGTYRTIVNVPGIPGVTGSGYLAVLHFHVISPAASSSTLALSNGFLNDNLAQEIPATWVGDSVTVYDEQPTITTSSPPDGVVGEAYSATFEATGGNGSYTWSISSGSLPDGLSLSPAGEISGTPTTEGIFSFTVEVTDGVLSSYKNITLDIYQCQPDINGDGSVNILDMIMLGQHMNETGSNGWIPEDINNDGTVNVLDIILIGQHWTG